MPRSLTVGRAGRALEHLTDLCPMFLGNRNHQRDFGAQAVRDTDRNPCDGRTTVENLKSDLGRSGLEAKRQQYGVLELGEESGDSSPESVVHLLGHPGPDRHADHDVTVPVPLLLERLAQ